MAEENSMAAPAGDAALVDSFRLRLDAEESLVDWVVSRQRRASAFRRGVAFYHKLNQLANELCDNTDANPEASLEELVELARESDFAGSMASAAFRREPSSGDRAEYQELVDALAAAIVVDRRAWKRR